MLTRLAEVLLDRVAHQMGLQGSFPFGLDPKPCRAVLAITHVLHQSPHRRKPCFGSISLGWAIFGARPSHVVRLEALKDRQHFTCPDRDSSPAQPGRVARLRLAESSICYPRC